MKQFYQSLLLETMEEKRHGVTAQEKTFDGGKVSRVRLEQDNPFERPAGMYITVEMMPAQEMSSDALLRTAEAVAQELIPMLRGERVLVAALGNNEITPDSLGPKMMKHLMITRPLELLQPEVFRAGHLRSVAAICTNVFGSTGVESAEMIAGVCRQIRPHTVIVIDALATEHLSRLCTTVQLSDGGLAPGAGVGNHRRWLTPQGLGVPVISMGMPTVMNAEKLTGRDDEATHQMIVTPTNIGTATDNGAKLLAYAINRALHGVEMEEIPGYLS